jgi:hypothetical protein
MKLVINFREREREREEGGGCGGVGKRERERERERDRFVGHAKYILKKMSRITVFDT